MIAVHTVSLLILHEFALLFLSRTVHLETKRNSREAEKECENKLGSRSVLAGNI
jgi:hypothetical protein